MEDSIHPAMPAQQIAQANPPPDASLLSKDILQFEAQINTKDYLSPDEHKSLDLFTRAANYISAGSVFCFEMSYIF